MLVGVVSDGQGHDSAQGGWRGGLQSSGLGLWRCLPASLLVPSWGLYFLSLISLMCRVGVKISALATEVCLWRCSLRLWEGTWDIILAFSSKAVCQSLWGWDAQSADFGASGLGAGWDSQLSHLPAACWVMGASSLTSLILASSAEMWEP